MNTLDIIILIIILIPALLGMKSGFLKSIFSLLSIIIGLFLATKFHTGLNLILQKVIKDESAVSIVSFLLILILVYLAGMYLASKLSKINSFTRTIDKIFGLVFGILKGLIIASLIVIFMKSYSMMSEKSFQSSLIYPYIYNFAPKTYEAVSTVLPFNKKSFEDLNPFLKKDSNQKK